MHDLFEKEVQVLAQAQKFLDSMGEEVPVHVHKEYAYLMGEYAQVLRQLRWVTRISDLTAQGLNMDKTILLNKVNVDALTEIYNRRFLTTNLEHYLEVLQNKGEWITIMMLDVDFFKNYNDTYGHPVGDICLRKVANTLHSSLTGAEDFVVRYGGEEFIAVLPGADKKTGCFVAQRILDNIWKLNIPHLNNKVADRITLSIGLVSVIPDSRYNMQQYIDKADTALYESKKNGRNKITCLDFEEDSI